MKLYYTVDVDRDVNIQIPGRTAAGSLDRGSGTDPRFSSSDAGLGVILDVLDDIGMRGTLFFEGRTAESIDCARAHGHRIGIHGYDHEDLTTLDDGTLRDVLRMSFDVVTDNVGRPSCSRAPYMNVDARVLGILVDVTGIRIDSSVYTGVGGSSEPYHMGGVMEFPVPKAHDSDGKVIAAYLWPMHEGKRRPEDYIRMAENLGGSMVLADHSWHMVEKRDSGMMSEEQIKQNADDMRRVLEGIMDLGFEPSVLPDCIP